LLSLFLSFLRLGFNGLTAFFGLLVVSLISGCSQVPAKPVPAVAAEKINMHDTQMVRKHLFNQYQVWEGTPYRYGGNSLDGVDCSAFVQNTYRNKLGFSIPRTTKNQVKIGVTVSKKQLEVGDIVFFKIGPNSLHNGIYIGNSEFMHASTSKGVTISNLHNVYWRQTYYKAVRIR